MPSNPNVAQPASGTYGEGAALDRLKSSLPAPPSGAGPTGAAPPAPSVEPPLSVPSGPEGRPGTAGPVPPGISSALLGPTAYPSRAVATPLGGLPGAAAPTPAIAAPDQARLHQLDLLATSPQVSEETRTWAKSVIDVLLGREE